MRLMNGILQQKHNIIKMLRELPDWYVVPMVARSLCISVLMGYYMYLYI